VSPNQRTKRSKKKHKKEEEIKKSSDGCGSARKSSTRHSLYLHHANTKGRGGRLPVGHPTLKKIYISVNEKNVIKIGIEVGGSFKRVGT
jgi:hypothetical protein